MGSAGLIRPAQRLWTLVLYFAAHHCLPVVSPTSHEGLSLQCSDCSFSFQLKSTVVKGVQAEQPAGNQIIRKCSAHFLPNQPSLFRNPSLVPPSATLQMSVLVMFSGCFARHPPGLLCFHPRSKQWQTAEVRLHCVCVRHRSAAKPLGHIVM